MQTNRTLLFLLSMLMAVVTAFGQTQFWSDDFEDIGSPSSGWRTPSNNIGLGDPSTYYFKRTTNSQIDLSFGSYAGQNGLSFWAGENHGGLFGPGNEEQNIVFSNIDISGKTGLTFKGLFAANNQAAAFENLALGASHSDYLIVEYAIDGGFYQPLFNFFANNNISSGTNNKTLAEDLNGDGIGEGTFLTTNFTTFTKTIAGTGTMLTLRIRCSSNGGNEEIAFDYFQLLADACVPPVVTANPPNRYICSGGNTSFGISATGATAYQWQVNAGSGFTDISNGGVYSGTTTSTLTVTGVTATMAGYSYRCVAMNGTASCSTNSNGATLSISNIITAGSKSDVSCDGGSNGAAAVSASGGVTPYSYSWSPYGGTGSVATGLAAGTYTVTVTDNIGCTATRHFTINQPTTLNVTASSQTNVSCNGASNGAASVNAATGGTPGYTYNWSPGNPIGDGTTSVTGLSAGTWTCTVTDANGCTSSQSFTVTQPAAISLTAASQTNIACNGGATGAAAVNPATGGAGGYTYNWTPGNPTGDGTTSVSGLSAGTWTCTVTDANGCTSARNFTITQPTALSLTAASQTNIACNGGATGAAAVNPATGGAGGYTYNWTPGNPTGDGTPSVTGLSAGTWTCTVTDANGCTSAVNFTVTQPTALSLTAASQTNIACNGGSNGAATVNSATGGTPGYTYNWTPGNPTGDGTPSVTGLSAGTWTCTVTDANWCTSAVNFTVTQPTALSLTAASQTNIACNGGSTGAASVNAATGGAGGYTYNWTPGNPIGDGTTSVTGLSAGTWTCTVTDANSCTSSQSFTITEPVAFVATITAQTNASCGGNDGALTVTLTGGTGNFDYVWSNGASTTNTSASTNTISGLSPGSYTVTITDANSCSTTATAIVVGDTEKPQLKIKDITAYLDASGLVTVNGSDLDDGSSDNCGIDHFNLSKSTFDCSEVGPNTVNVEVVDLAGNINSSGSSILNFDQAFGTNNWNEDGYHWYFEGWDNIRTYHPQAGTGHWIAAPMSGGLVAEVAMQVNSIQVYVDDMMMTGVNVTLNGYNSLGQVTHSKTIPSNMIFGYQSVSLNWNDVKKIEVTWLDDPMHPISVFLDEMDYEIPSTAVVTVVDTIKPVLATQNLTAYLDATGNATITAAQIDNGSTDACGIDTLILDMYSFSCVDTGTHTVILTATDVNGNSSTKSATVIVRDTLTPKPEGRDITVYLDATGQASIDSADMIQMVGKYRIDMLMPFMGNQMDLFIYPEPGVDLADFDGLYFSIAGSAMYQFHVIHGSGAYANVFVDTNGPSPTPDVMSLFGHGIFGDSITFYGVNSLDNCGKTTIAFSQDNFSCADAGSNPIVVTTTDMNGNSADTTVNVAVLDTIRPVISTQNITAYLDASGQAIIKVVDVDYGTADNCSMDTLMLDTYSFSCADTGVNAVTLTAIDVNGNSSSKTAVVTVLDTISPLVQTQGITAYLDASGNASITAADIDNGSTDACGIDTLILNTYSFNCADTGANPVTLTATDVNGNMTTKTAVVTVLDTISPLVQTQDISAYLDASGIVSITATEIDNGSADACGIDTLILDTYSFNCADTGANTITLTAIDVNGNSYTKTAVVTVVDTISPVIQTQDFTVYLDAIGNADITATQIDNSSTDGCGIDTLILDTYSFSCADTGANAVTLTATDENGNSSSKTAVITVLDTISPLVQTQGITAYLDASGNASITAGQIDNGSTDACGIDTLYLDTYNFNCANGGANTVALTAIDVNGNSTTETAVITVKDTISPVAATQNITAYLDAAGQATINATYVDHFSNDACGIDTLILNKYNFNCTEIGANTITLTAIDVNGNTSSKTAVVTVMDTISPVIGTQDLTVYLDASGNSTITAADIDLLSADACGVDTLILNNYNFNCGNVGANTITLTATDVNGNSASKTAVVTVMDTISPVVLTQNVTVYLDAAGQASITTSDVNTSTTDACGIAGYSLSQSNFDCSHSGNNTVVLTATDVNGNSSSENAIVEVRDTISPIAITKGITVYLDQNGTVTIPASAVDNGSSDNCSFTLSLSNNTFDCTQTGLNLETFTITDASGNSASKDVLITVKDTISPKLHLYKKITVALDQFGNATISPSQLDSASSDNCSNLLFFAASKTNYDCSNLGENLITVTAYDNKNNSSVATAIVEVKDYMAPVVSTKNITTYLTASGTVTVPVADVDNNSADNCAVDSIWLDKSSFGCADLGQNVVKLYVKDQSGNTATGNAVITIADTIAPDVFTQNVSVYLDATGNATITASQLNDGSTDNCSVQSLSLSQANFSCADIGTKNVTLTVTDGNSNQASAIAQVTVIDTIIPAVAAQNITVTLDAGGNASISAASVNNGSADACGIQSMSLDVTSFSCADLGANTVNLTVVDNHGNTNTKTATVTVVDNIQPVVATQDITIYLDANGDASITPADINNGSTDNCGISNYSLDISVFDCADLGQNLVTLSATDASNNTASKTAFVTVLDTINPSIDNLPANITVYATANQCAANVQWPAITASDNCNIAAITTSEANGALFSLGTTSVNVTAADGSGNSVTQSFDVIVVDTVAPVISNVPSNYTVVSNINSCDAVVNWVEPVALDNCGGISWTKSHLPGAVFPVGNTTVTYTATDNDNNSATITFVVTVTDQVAPVISSIPANITVDADAGSCDAMVNFTMPSVTDNCAGATVSSSHASGSIFPLGTTTVTFTATDVANNVSTASFTITVEDNQKPVVSNVPANDTVGACGAVYTYALPQATDNCSAVNVVQTAGLPSGSIFPAGVTVNRFRISDLNGNDTTVSFTIVVVPQGVPTLPGLLEICESSPAVELTMGQNLSWSGNGIINGTTFDPAAAGTGRHKLEYAFEDKMGCATTGSIYVTVLPQPVKPVVTKTGSTTLTTGNYITYQWYRDGVEIAGATSQSLNYTTAGNYQVMVTNTSGCENYSDGLVVGTANGGIGIEEDLFGNLQLYPNPSSGLVTIDLNRVQLQELEVAVYNTAGKKVYELHEQTSQEGKVTLDMSHLPDAAYFIQIRSAAETVVKRVVLY